MAKPEIFVIFGTNGKPTYFGESDRTTILAALNKGSPSGKPRYSIATGAQLESAWKDGASWCVASYAVGPNNSNASGYPMNYAGSQGAGWCGLESWRTHNLITGWTGDAGLLVYGIKPVPGEAAPSGSSFRVRWIDGAAQPSYLGVELDLSGLGAWEYRIASFHPTRYLQNVSEELRRVRGLEEVTTSNQSTVTAVGIKPESESASVALLVIGILCIVGVAVTEGFFYWKKQGRVGNVKNVIRPSPSVQSLPIARYGQVPVNGPFGYGSNPISTF